MRGLLEKGNGGKGRPPAPRCSSSPGAAGAEGAQSMSPGAGISCELRLKDPTAAGRMRKNRQWVRFSYI